MNAVGWGWNMPERKGQEPKVKSQKPETRSQKSQERPSKPSPLLVCRFFKT